jgi:hypothetical protein
MLADCQETNRRSRLGLEQKPSTMARHFYTMAIDHHVGNLEIEVKLRIAELAEWSHPY